MEPFRHYEGCHRNKSCSAQSRISSCQLVIALILTQHECSIMAETIILVQPEVKHTKVMDHDSLPVKIKPAIFLKPRKALS